MLREGAAILAVPVLRSDKQHLNDKTDGFVFASGKSVLSYIHLRESVMASLHGGLQNQNGPPAIRVALGGLLAFAAVNAFAGGIYGMAGASGVPLSWLAGSPFTSYFVPSLVLFFIVGGSFGIAGFAILTRHRRGRMAAAAAGCVALGWIAIQVTVIGYVSWLQPATAAAGLAMICLAAALRSNTASVHP